MTGVDTAGDLAAGVTKAFFAGLSSSESLLLLDGAGRFAGVDVGNALCGAGVVAPAVLFFFLSSSLDESESDELSFFFVAAPTVLFVGTGVAGAMMYTNYIPY